MSLLKTFSKKKRRARGISAAHQYFSAEAVVLRSGARGEFDAVVVLSSPQYGLLTVKMPGVRRARSKLKPFKEPAMHVELHCYGRPGQNRIPTLLTGRLLDSFELLRSSYGKLRCALSILRFSELFLTPFDPKAKEKFLLLIETMKRLAQEFPKRDPVITSGPTRRWEPSPFSIKQELKVGVSLMSGLAQRRCHPSQELLFLAYKLKVLDLSGWRFSASDAARTILDDKMLGYCENLENEPGFEEKDSESQDLQKLEYVVNGYVEKLAAGVVS